MEEQVAAGEENAMGKAEEEEESEDVCVWSVICNGGEKVWRQKMKGSYLSLSVAVCVPNPNLFIYL